jgi:acyl-CoA thioester hydrolase
MRIQIPEHKTLVRTQTIAMRWGDMDAMGHLNNASYFRYLETIRIDWMHAVGCYPDPQGEGPVILNAFCNFNKQLVYPGDVLARMYVSDVADKTFETWCSLSRSDAPDEVCAEGGATTVWVNFPAQKAVRMPDWLRTKLLNPAP